MRILVDARLDWGSGIGRVVANTLPGVVRRLADARFDLLVAPDQAERARAALGAAANLRIVESDIRPFSVREQLELPRLASDYALTWFTNYWVPLRWRGRFVVTVHDMLHLEPRLFPSTRVRRIASARTFAKVRRDAAAVMFDSRFSEREFKRLIGAPTGRGTTIHLGGDHLDGPPLNWDWRGRPKRLLAVAAAKSHKNFGMVLEAWQRASVPDHWRLTIVTPDDRLRSSVDLARMAMHGGQIDLLRGLSDADLQDLYRQSAILLLPSLYEGFGLPLLEGMRAGVFCISSTADSLVEIAEGAFIRFVPGRDLPGWTKAIEEGCKLFDRPDFDLEPILRRNYERAGQYRWSDTADRVAAVMSDALASAQRH